jgi:hypothetical protein
MILTRFRALRLCFRFRSIRIPRCTVATYKASDTFRVDVLAIHPESSLLPLGGAFLLLAKHDVDLFGLDILPDMPCRETVFVLFFSD